MPVNVDRGRTYAAPSTHAPTASTPDPQPTSRTVDPARQRSANCAASTASSSGGRRDRTSPPVRCATQSFEAPNWDSVRTGPMPDRSPDPLRPTPAGHGRAMCRRPLRRLQRTPRPSCQSLRRGSDHRIGIVTRATSTTPPHRPQHALRSPRRRATTAHRMRVRHRRR